MNSNVFGITANRWLAEFAQLRLLLFNGEPDNVFVGNSLQTDMVEALGLPAKFDVVLTVLPIGSPSDAEELDTYELASPGRTASEVLYIERSFQLLKQGGCMVLLLPESLLHLDRFKRVRRWLVEHLRIDAILRLGHEAAESLAVVSMAIIKATKTTTQDQVIFVAQLHREVAQPEKRQVELEDIREAFAAFHSGESTSDVGWPVQQAALGEDWTIVALGPEYQHFHDSLFALPLPIVTLGEIADIRVGRGIRARQNTEKGVSVIRGRHLQDGELDLADADRAEVPANSPGVFLENGDLALPLLSRYPVPVLVTNLNAPAIIDSSVVRIRLKVEAIMSEFLQFLFTTDLIQYQITSTSSQLRGLSRITPSSLNNILVPVPSLATQQEIADELHKAKQLRAEAEAIETNLRTNMLRRLQEPDKNG